MKTILTLGGDDYLIAGEDLPKILELLQGARRLHDETRYGPEEHRYEEDWGYITRRAVMANEPGMKLKLELADEVEFCTRAEWYELAAQAEARQADSEKKAAALPAAA